MRNIVILLSLFILASCQSCEKNQGVSANDLIGVWASPENNLQFTIRNIEGQGNSPTFLKVREGDEDLLKVDAAGGKFVYKIISVNKTDLNLSDKADPSNKILHFFKVK